MKSSEERFIEDIIELIFSFRLLFLDLFKFGNWGLFVIMLESIFSLSSENIWLLVLPKLFLFGKIIVLFSDEFKSCSCSSSKLLYD